MQKTLKEEAEAYEPSTIKNIAELKQVSTTLEVMEETFKEGTDEQFVAKYVIVEDEKYRVPASVLKSLKAILEDNPEIKNFRVIKSGSGMDTTYTVIPMA